MKSLCIISMIFLLLSGCTCKNVQQGVVRSYKLHRQFFTDLAFKGTVDKSEFCERCEVNKYRLVIKLNFVEPDININNQSFQPYYHFDNDNLTISVTQKLYEDAKNGMDISKERNSDFLIMEKDEYRILNQDSNVWLSK